MVTLFFESDTQTAPSNIFMAAEVAPEAVSASQQFGTAFASAYSEIVCTAI